MPICSMAPMELERERTAFGLAQALVCERRAPGIAQACGGCSACIRAIPIDGERTPAHPDVIVLRARAVRPGSVWKTDSGNAGLERRPSARARSQASRIHSATRVAPRVFIVRRAEELSISASNALLKTLEEPRPQTLFHPDDCDHPQTFFPRFGLEPSACDLGLCGRSDLRTARGARAPAG